MVVSSNKKRSKSLAANKHAHQSFSTGKKPSKFKAGNDLGKTVKGPNAKPPKPKNMAKAGNELGKTVK